MTILDKNIAEIKRYNEVLTNKIANYVVDGNIKFEFIKSESEDVNLIYNGILVHDNVNPQKEAVDIFSEIKDVSASSIIIVFGLGLGYLFKRVYLGSKSKIIIYEPNLDILRFTLEVVDFSAELADERVFIANTKTELLKFLDTIYTYKDSMDICSLKSVNNLYSDQLNDLKENLSEIQSGLERNLTCLFEKSFNWASEGMKNIPDMSNNYNIDTLRDKFKHKPAVIVSSGPSLDKNIEFLRQYRDKVIIFCVSNAYKTLVHYNIRPDFIAFIDNHDCTNVVKDLDISDIPLIIQANANSKLFKLNDSPKFVFYSNNDVFSRWLSKIADFSTQDYENKGTVSYCSLYSAFMMGCNPLILVGQDLAYTEGKCYSSNSTFAHAYKCIFDEDLGKYKMVIDNVENFIEHYTPVTSMSQYFLDLHAIRVANFPVATIMGQDGKPMPTDPNYATFIHFFEEFAYDHSESELINSSTGGAQINGFKNVELEKVLQNLNPVDINITSVIEQTILNYKEPVKEKIIDIKSNIKCIIEDIDKFIPFAKDGFQKSNRLLIELKRNNPNIKLIKDLSDSLINYYFKFKEDLFDRHSILINCVFKELMELTMIFEKENASPGLEDLIDIAQVSRAFYESFLNNQAEFKNTAQNTYEML